MASFQMVNFGIVLDNFQMISFGTILKHFGPKAAQMLQMSSFGTILEQFVPKAAQMLAFRAKGRPGAHNWKFRLNFQPFAFGWISLDTVFISE